jgi:predicted Fe-S protein YdhL (DUF1289 family)
MNLPTGRHCIGCGRYIHFKIDYEDGKMKAYEGGNILHKCPEYEEAQRLSSDRTLIDSARTLVAATNHILRKHRLELRVIDLDGAPT